MKRKRAKVMSRRPIAATWKYNTDVCHEYTCTEYAYIDRYNTNTSFITEIYNSWGHRVPCSGLPVGAQASPLDLYAYRLAKDQQTRHDARPISAARPAAAADIQQNGNRVAATALAAMHFIFSVSGLYLHIHTDHPM